jgi:serine/threonine protein kinase
VQGTAMQRRRARRLGAAGCYHRSKRAVPARAARRVACGVCAGARSHPSIPTPTPLPAPGHRDIKTGNIMLTSAGDVQVGTPPPRRPRRAAAAAACGRPAWHIPPARGPPHEALPRLARPIAFRPRPRGERLGAIPPPHPTPLQPPTPAPRLARLQLGDFGLATYRGADGEQHEDTNLVGTPHYMSPELLSQRGYGFKSDTWWAGGRAGGAPRVAGASLGAGRA